MGLPSMIVLTIGRLHKWSANMTIPKDLKKFLDNLPVVEKRRVWAFLDGDPQALEKMIECVGQKYSNKYLDVSKGK